MKPSAWTVISFFGACAGGNRHRVTLYRSPWPQLDLVSYGNCISVELCQEDVAAPGVFRARFSYNGRRILRCGSGYAATAYVLLKVLELEPPLTLLTPCEKIHLTREASRFGYWAPSLTIYPCPITDIRYYRHCFFNSQANAYWYAGGTQDYVIAVFDSAQQVADLQPNFTVMENVNRAIIASAVSSEPAECDFVLRYFAPRYGIREDAATGSANVILAHFWANKLGKNNLRSIQLSAQRGAFDLVLEGAIKPPLNTPCRVKVLGAVQILDELNI